MPRPRSDALIPTRESLLGRLKNWEDQDGWREFFGIYRSLIFGTAIKAGLSEQEAEDVVQETVLSVAKAIKGFQYDPQRCRFKSWLGHLTRRRIADHFRKRSREPAAPSDRACECPPGPDGVSLDAIWDEHWRQTLLDTALANIKTQVNPEQYQMFDLYVLRHVPARKVAASLGTNIGQVYLAKHRISKLLKSEIKSLKSRLE